MIDLHTHSTCSDGTSTPVELLQQAARSGIRALAITDHDTLAGFDAARPLAEKHNVELLCGIEITTQFERPPERKLVVHLLGYFPGCLPDEEFRSWLISISATRRQRNLKLMEMLRSLGIRISWQDFPNDLGRVARPEFANVLVAKGYASDIQTAFDRFLDDSIIAGIAPELPSTHKAIQKIHQNGGVASLAHPARLRCSESSPLESLVQELARHGLDAVEAYHSDHSTGQIQELLHLAAALNLIITGGSDYHGRHKPDVHMGTGRNGNLHLPYELVERIKECRRGKATQ